MVKLGKERNEEEGMTVTEAIGLQIELLHLLPEIGLDKYTVSVGLGIEALHRCAELRKYTDPAAYMALRGETEE